MTQHEALARIEAFRRRRQRLRDDVITMSHGAGGKASATLTDAVFLEAFRNPALEQLGDAALLELPAGPQLAFSTDSYVVKPLLFPGGSIGHLAVHGTVNDLAVSGAIPRWLSAAFVLEEGLPIETLRTIVADMQAAALEAGVEIVTGDTKVVPRGAADGMYVTTSGVGLVRAGITLGANQVRAGDAMLLSGPMGRHGTAVMLARDELAVQADITSDTAPLNGIIGDLLSAVPQTRWMRDATRGGVATVCNELAQGTQLAVILDEATLPIPAEVAAVGDLLGIDPLYVANEGMFVAVVPVEAADTALATLRAHPLGRQAVVVGQIRPDPAGVVALRTLYGGSRIVDMLVGDPLPRIC